MHTRVTTLVFQRDKVDEAIQLIRSRIGELQQIAGYRDFLFLADRASGKTMILTLWESEGDLRATEASGYPQARMVELAPFSIGQPTREVCEVVVDDVAGIGDAGGAHAARVTTLLFQPGKIDESVRILRESILPVSRQQKGFRGLLTALDRGVGKGSTYSFWESEGDLAASEASGYYKAQVAKLLPLSVGTPTREVYELTLPALVPASAAQTQPHAPMP